MMSDAQVEMEGDDDVARFIPSVGYSIQRHVAVLKTTEERHVGVVTILAWLLYSDGINVTVLVTLLNIVPSIFCADWLNSHVLPFHFILNAYLCLF